MYLSGSSTDSMLDDFEFSTDSCLNPQKFIQESELGHLLRSREQHSTRSNGLVAPPVRALRAIPPFSALTKSSGIAYAANGSFATELCVGPYVWRPWMTCCHNGEKFQTVCSQRPGGPITVKGILEIKYREDQGSGRH
ncbi:hypothetical protein AcV7_006734 [Taiwanofungus camphoratus]|nr:hypothetical protein AcV7_006734 [Antrodia cinnamomea]